MKIFENKKVLIPVAVVLAVAILFASTFGIVIGVTSGEKIDCEQVSADYNSSKPDFTSYFGGMSEAELTTELDAFDAQLAAIVAGVDVLSMLYCDTVATLLTRFTAELLKIDLASLKFKTLKKQYPAAYEYVKAQQDAGASWETLGTIPFGITPGDKEGFIKASAAGAQHLGDRLLNVMLCAPSAYDDALVPALEALHLEEMPSLFGFVAKTGLSGSKRVEFLLTRILAIIEPTLASPLTYLCEMLPDFIINYRRACEFINGNEKIAEKTNLVMPTIEEILSGLISALGMTQPPLNLDELSKTGVTSTQSSGGNGDRVRYSGDREVVFAYLAKYIMSVLTYENNFKVVEKILTVDLKSDTVANSPFASMLTSQQANSMIASLMDILFKLQPAKTDDIQAKVDAHNSKPKDFSSLYSWPLTKENVTSTLDSVDETLVGIIADLNIENILFTDSFATMIAKITAELCGKSFGDISFRAMSKTFPEAYNFVKAAQAEGKTWDDIETIPFGITEGDREGFVKACGAGAEHFGDALALCLMSDVNSYDNGLLPLLEGLQTGAMSNLEGFVGAQGLDSEVRMCQVTEKVLTILEPIKTAPLTFLCSMLPDLINGFNQSAAVMNANPNAAIHLPTINELIGGLISDLGITMTLPDFDFSTFTDMATASVAPSGNCFGKRMELKGDREAIFMTLAGFIFDVAKDSNNLNAIVTFAGEKLGMDETVVNALIGIVNTISSLGGMLSGITA